MSSHREIFDLNDDFNYKIQYAINDLCSKCSEIKNNLNSYNININTGSYFYDLSDCQNFVARLKEKKNEINKSNNSNENNLSNLSKTNEKSLCLLKLEHEEKMGKIKDKFLEKEKYYTKENKIQENKLNEKEEEKKKLESDIVQIDKDRDLILDNFDKEQRKIAEKEFKNNKNDIEKKYIFIKEKLEYTEDELKIMKQYKDEIEKIKKYSNNPFYSNFIFSFGLNKYIN